MPVTARVITKYMFRIGDSDIDLHGLHCYREGATVVILLMAEIR